MKLAVLSDTHVGERIYCFPQVLLNEVVHCDGIIHCGDFVNFSAYETLKQLGKPIWAICGNMDEPEITRVLPSTTRLKLEEFDIFVCHGWGGPSGIEKRILEYIRKKNLAMPDIVLFGHSHVPFEGKLEGIRFFNPGSVSGNLFSSKGSFGILEISAQKIHWQLKNISIR